MLGQCSNAHRRGIITNKLAKEKRMEVVAALVEGSNGTGFTKYQDDTLRNLSCKRFSVMKFGVLLQIRNLSDSNVAPMVGTPKL